ncbi:MAG: TspO/MBR family protein [Candidatus Pacearchaeota archaeon]
MKHKTNWKAFAVSLLVVYLIAFIGSIFTSSETDGDWYQSIRPSITPPNWVFPVVWNILFFLIAISLYFAWITAKDYKTKNRIIIVFGFNFILNVLWSVLYFGLRNPLFAFYEIIFLWLSIILMIYTTYKINRKSAYLLIPYLLWVSFAIILNYLSAF